MPKMWCFSRLRIYLFNFNIITITISINRTSRKCPSRNFGDIRIKYIDFSWRKCIWKFRTRTADKLVKVSMYASLRPSHAYTSVNRIITAFRLFCAKQLPENDGIFMILSENHLWNSNQNVSFKKMHSNISTAKFWHFCLGLNVLSKGYPVSPDTVQYFGIDLMTFEEPSSFR